MANFELLSEQHSSYVFNAKVPLVTTFVAPPVCSSVHPRPDHIKTVGLGM